MTPWAGKELQYADLGDARLNKRLVKIVEDLATHPLENLLFLIKYPFSNNYVSSQITYRYRGVLY